MILVERHIFKDSHKDYKELDNLCFLSKNLYNATLYTMRQRYFTDKTVLNYNEVNRLFTHGNQVDYRALPAKVSKWTQKLVWQNMKSFFAKIKVDKGSRPPKYLNPAKGRQVVHYEKGALSFVKRKGYIHLSRTGIYIKSKVGKSDVRFVRLVPKGNHITVEVGYKVPVAGLKGDNGRYASIDLGVNNLMMVSSNVVAPYIINGRPLKSINQYYNKVLSKERSRIKGRHGLNSSKRLKTLSRKRTNKITDYLHKASTYVVNQLVSDGINTLVLGYNTGWKQDIALGRVGNQNFVGIPYYRLKGMLEYKCKRLGISLVLQEESYTSVSSFIDIDKFGDSCSGSRISRGLYRSREGILLNADLNGSLNILRKYLEGNALWEGSMYLDCIEASSTPNLRKVRNFT